jgi:hypothetical protein
MHCALPFYLSNTSTVFKILPSIIFHLHLPKLHSIAFSGMDTVSSQSTSHTLESLPKRAHLAEAFEAWTAFNCHVLIESANFPNDFLRHGAKGENPIFMIVNKYRAAGDLNRWAIRPEIEPQLRQWWSDPPALQPPFL